MSKYIFKQKTFVKSLNSYNAIMKRYTYSLGVLVLLLLTSYYIFDYEEEIIPLLKSLLLSMIFASLMQYLINVFKKQKKIKYIYTDNHIHLAAIIIGLFCQNAPILVIFCATLLTIIVKNAFKNINVSASLYGVLVVTLYRYFVNDVIIPTEFSITSPDSMLAILSLLAFGYLFFKKSIKYNIVISFLITFVFLVLIYGIFIQHDALYLLMHLIYQSIIFLTVFTLTDYKASPTLNECQLLYGITVGILAASLTAFIPVIAPAASFIVGELVFSNLFEKLSLRIKLKK